MSVIRLLDKNGKKSQTSRSIVINQIVLANLGVMNGVYGE